MGRGAGLPRFFVVAERFRGGFRFHLGLPGPAHDRPIPPDILQRDARLGPPDAPVPEHRNCVPLVRVARPLFVHGCFLSHAHREIAVDPLRGQRTEVNPRRVEGTSLAENQSQY